MSASTERVSAPCPGETDHTTAHRFRPAWWLTIALTTLLLTACERGTDERPRVERLYLQSCTSCHERGLANAPRRGDQARWQRLIDDKGMETLVRHTVEGYRGMPPRGACFDCDDDDFAELILFMKDGHSEQ